MKIIYNLILFIGVISLSCCSEKRSSTKAKSEEKALKEYQQSLLDIQESARSEMNEEGGYTSDSKHLDKMIEASKKLEKSVSGDASKIAAVGRLVMQMMQEDTADLTEFQAGLVESLEYNAIHEVSDIDKLSARVIPYQKANAELTQRIKVRWIKEIEEILKREDVPMAERKKFMRGFKGVFSKQLPLLLIIRNADEILCQEILVQHSVLKKHYGKWQWSEKLQNVEFTGDEGIEAFNKAAQKIQSAAEMQVEAQKKLFKL